MISWLEFEITLGGTLKEGVVGSAELSIPPPPHEDGRKALDAVSCNLIKNTKFI